MGQVLSDYEKSKIGDTHFDGVTLRDLFAMFAPPQDVFPPKFFKYGRQDPPEMESEEKRRYRYAGVMLAERARLCLLRAEKMRMEYDSQE